MGARRRTAGSYARRGPVREPYDTAAPFHRVGKKSSCERVIAELATHLPTYNKGLKNIYDLLAPKTR
jgi:hypothetical protein